MLAALAEADLAAKENEVPVGAVVVKDGQIIARGHNQSIQLNDPTAHAEMMAIREAGRVLGNYRLSGCALYTTLEPCAMCAGAIVHARCGHVVFAAHDPKAGAIGSVMNVFQHSLHQPVTTHGLMAEAAQTRLQDFFKHKRAVYQELNLTVREATWQGQDKQLLKRIRFTVFVEEQQVPAEIELDDFDAVSEHALCFDPGGQAIGCGRLLPDGHIGRMAVLKSWRGRGVGAKILLHLMTLARQKGHTEVVLSAQTHALPFYEIMGFVARGPEYMEAGISHREMSAKI
ncbi:MAG: haloalkane dehalogenase domain protein [Pseudomonadota bacterium]